MSEEQLNEIFK